MLLVSKNNVIKERCGADIEGTSAAFRIESFVPGT
jgi:hypothetical protein